MDFKDLVDFIKKYYAERGLKWPTFSDAMKFVHTEIAEVYELDLDRVGGFVRNHPDSKPKFNKEDLSEELGDAIFMLMVAGIVEGVNPLDSMVNKMQSKLNKLHEPNGMTYGQTIPEDFTVEGWKGEHIGGVNHE